MLGAIARPGRYRFDSSMTLLDLLAEAGGPTSSAYIKKIVVINMATSGQGDQAKAMNMLHRTIIIHMYTPLLEETAYA